MKTASSGSRCVSAAPRSSHGLRAQQPLPEPKITPPFVTVDLNIGESQEVTLDGKKVAVKLLELKETSDSLRNAVRRAEATVEVAGQKVTLVSANYRLPVTVGGVQIDCPVTRGYTKNSTKTTGGLAPWGLEKDARLRLWPAGSPWINPGTFQYPAKQAWFASQTQMANEPTYVDGGERPGMGSVYYHYGLDIGGAEGLIDVVAATDGLVVSVGKEVLPGYEDTPVSPRYDVLYLLDDRGWFYRYSHLHTIAADLKPGQTRPPRPAARHPGQGRRQRRLVAPALRHQRQAAVGQVGHHRRLCVPLGGVPAASTSRS